MSDYVLEIYEPQSVRDVWVSFESDQPFGHLNVGDILSNSMLPDAKASETIFVAKLEHIFWQSPEQDRVAHKIMVFTSRSFGDPVGLRQ